MATMTSSTVGAFSGVSPCRTFARGQGQNHLRI